MHAVVPHEVLLVRKVEERAMRHSRLLGRRARIRRPRIEMRVEVNDRDGAVNFIQGSEDG